MTSRDFCFWLQGFFELRAKDPMGFTGITFDQTEAIKRHLALVFAHEIDPKADGGNPGAKAALDAIHHGDKVTMRC